MNRMLAHLAKICAIVMFAIIGSSTIDYLGAFSSSQQAFISDFISIPILAFLYFILPSDKMVNTKYDYRLSLYVLRVCIAIVAKYCWLESLRRIGLTNTVSIMYLAPIFSIIISIVMLKERFLAYWVIPFGMAFIGGIIIIFVNLSGNSEGNSMMTLCGCIMALIAAICYGSYDVLCRKQAQHEHYVLQMLYTSIGSSIALLPFALKDFGIEQVHAAVSCVSQYEIMVINIAIMLSLLSVVAVLLTFFAYRFAEVTELAVHNYLRLAITAIYMYFLKDELPSFLLVIGALFIVCGNTMILRDDRMKGS